MWRVVLRGDVLERAELRAALVALTDLPQMTGERLRAVRKVLGLTQRKLGEKLGMAHETLSRFENAEEPSPDWLRAAMLGLVSEQLTGLDGHESIEIYRSQREVGAERGPDVALRTRPCRSV